MEVNWLLPALLPRVQKRVKYQTFPRACGQGFSHYRLGTPAWDFLDRKRKLHKRRLSGGFKDAVSCTSLLVSYRVTTEVREHESTDLLVVRLTCLDH